MLHRIPKFPNFIVKKFSLVVTAAIYQAHLFYSSILRKSSEYFNSHDKTSYWEKQVNGYIMFSLLKGLLLKLFEDDIFFFFFLVFHDRIFYV